MFCWLAARIRNICEKYPNRDFESELKAKWVKRMSMEKKDLRSNPIWWPFSYPRKIHSARSAAFSPSIDGSHRPF
tara:strand:+ start:483 stop:707 length:225 start_codon:yes stop_codon:yes gene_type:complete